MNAVCTLTYRLMIVAGCIGKWVVSRWQALTCFRVGFDNVNIF